MLWRLEGEAGNFRKPQPFESLEALAAYEWSSKDEDAAEDASVFTAKGEMGKGEAALEDGSVFTANGDISKGEAAVEDGSALSCRLQTGAGEDVTVDDASVFTCEVGPHMFVWAWSNNCRPRSTNSKIRNSAMVSVV